VLPLARLEGRGTQKSRQEIVVVFHVPVDDQTGTQSAKAGHLGNGATSLYFSNNLKFESWGKKRRILDMTYFSVV
jgi:hypothetical protein